MVVAKRKDSIVEIKDLDDLLRVVKEVRAEDEPLILQVDDGDEIVVSPAPRRSRRRRLTPEERKKADDEAFFSSAGSLKGHLDPEEFKRQIREGRGHGRPHMIGVLTQEQFDRAMSAAGALKDSIDPDKLKAEIKAARSSRPRIPEE